MAESTAASQGALEKVIVWKLSKTKAPASMDNDDLLFAHSMTHAFHNNITRGIKIKGWEEADLIAYHEKIVKEMVTREFLVRLTSNVLDDSVKHLFPEVSKVPDGTEKSLGVSDAGAAMSKPAKAKLVHEFLVCPKCKKSSESSATNVCPSCGATLEDDSHQDMSKAYEYFTLFEADSILAALTIAEEAGMLKPVSTDK